MNETIKENEIDFEKLLNNVIHIANYVNAQAKTLSLIMREVRELNKQNKTINNTLRTLEARIDFLQKQVGPTTPDGINVNDMDSGETRHKGN